MTVAFVLLVVEMLVPAVRRLFSHQARRMRSGERPRRLGGPTQDD